MGESLKAPLVPKEGFEGASAPPAPGYPPIGPSGAGTSASGYPATGYPVIGPAASPYPPIPASSLGSAAAQQHYLAPSPNAPPVLVAAQPVLVCREDHHHHCHEGQVMCGSCRRVVTPMAFKELGLCACMGAIGLCASGCWLCAWLPLCVNVTKDTVYRCPVCSSEVYRRRAPFE